MSEKEKSEPPTDTEETPQSPTTTATTAGGEDGSRTEEGGAAEEEDAPHDPHYEPIITLPLVELPNSEADEEPMLQLRAKLYRMDRSGDQPEWKERGTGDVKILRHKSKPRTRLLMRRDKTLKVCANHFVTEGITLMPNCGSDRAWVWSVACDFSDEEPKSEMLAIRFANAENAKKFKEVFVEAQTIMKEGLSRADEQDQESADEQEQEVPGGVADKLAGLTVQDSGPASADS